MNFQWEPEAFKDPILNIEFKVPKKNIVCQICVRDYGLKVVQVFDARHGVKPGRARSKQII